MAKKKVSKGAKTKRKPLVPVGTKRRLSGKGLSAYRDILHSAGKVKVLAEKAAVEASTPKRRAAAKGKRAKLTKEILNKTIDERAPKVTDEELKEAGGLSKLDIAMRKLAECMGFEDLQLSGNDEVRQKKVTMLKALVMTMNNVSQMCIVTGLGRGLYRFYEQTDMVFAQALLDMKHIALDFVESKLLQSIGEGNVTAIIYYLRTQGRSRGWDDRTNPLGRMGYVPDPQGDDQRAPAPSPELTAANAFIADLQKEVAPSSLSSILGAIAEVAAENKSGRIYEAEVITGK